MENKKIFIIEDDANILYGLESQFSADEFEVGTATGDEEIEELMEELRDFEPDFIILDLILPKIDGFEIVKRLKSDDELNDKQIFIFTDLSDEDSRQRSLQLGADYVFFKEEFDTFEFVEKVKRIVAVQEKTVDRDYEE
ncbi:MAG: response regulator [Patescibacteria group bacterium]|jgi:DNA-binding response OmpR family regulator